MTEQEIERAVQYVTATTSYSRETVSQIVTTCLSELADLATHGRRNFERDALMEYVSQWTIRKTGQPEPLVREVLGCASRWLDETCEQVLVPVGSKAGDSAADDDDAAGGRA
ncbi:MAG: hypothetical protein U0172_00135 [Nitrospiraceae bacterium]